MPTPYGLKMSESCAGCEHAQERPFCALDDKALRGLDQIKFAAVYPRGAVLFVEGQTPRGVYIVCSGQVKLSTSSGEARVLITNLAGPGEILGLSAAVSGQPYEVTAETLEPAQVNFVKREDFLGFISGNAAAALKVARQLAGNYRTAFDQARLLGLSGSAAGKLARLLCDCVDRHGRPNVQGVSIKMTLTHEEIGQLIGASRETVTRLFSDFKAQRLLEIRGATLVVRDRAALDAVADT